MFCIHSWTLLRATELLAKPRALLSVGRATRSVLVSMVKNGADGERWWKWPTSSDVYRDYQLAEFRLPRKC